MVITRALLLLVSGGEKVMRIFTVVLNDEFHIL
jgi:hypothetical protein